MFFCLSICPFLLYKYFHLEHTIALNFFVGEGLKIGITAILFAVVWTNFKDLRTVAVLIGFIIAVLAGQMSLPFLRNGTRI